MKVYHLKFNREADGFWYIDIPNYPFSHHNLMMVEGADRLCAYFADKEGHPEYAEVDVTVNDNLRDGEMPEVVMERYRVDYGAYYNNKKQNNLPPYLVRNGQISNITKAWLCPVTLFVLHQYPRKINLYTR